MLTSDADTEEEAVGCQGCEEPLNAVMSTIRSRAEGGKQYEDDGG